jgi:hypothetical protein
MATLTTKYSIGDVVYHAFTKTERKQHPCPDCQGSRKWKATSPAGGEYEFRCPRCSASYTSDHDMSLAYTASVPVVQRLTIGSIQYNTEPGSYDHGARYMCRETGVGSGSVYNEDDLSETEEAATAAAEAKAALQNTTVEWIAALYNKTLEVSDYELENGKLKQAKEAAYLARELLWNLDDLFGRIGEADGKGEILDLIDDYKRHDWSRDREKAGLEPLPDIMKLHDETMSAITEAAP